jgi:thymidine kinase
MIAWNNDVDSVVRGLNKTVAKLLKLSAQKDAELTKAAERIASLSDHCDCCRNEAERASRIADKIKELVA